MDFNVLIADLNSSIESLTKGSAAGSNINSAYCRKVSKVVDQIANNNVYSNVVTGLWCVATNVAAHVDYLKPIRAFSQLCLKIFRQCAKVILNIQWQNLEDSSLRQNFLASLKSLHGKLVPLSFSHFHLLDGLSEDPWTHPTLAKIMGGEIDDSNKEEVHGYIEKEDPIILQLRVDMMLKENCEEFALNLCNSYLSHPKLQSDLNIRKTQLFLLYKLGQEDKLQEECQKLNIQVAVQVIKLLQTSRTHRKMCTVLTQTFMVQNWIRPSDVEASKELLKLWIGHQLVVDKEQDQFKESVWAVAKLSQATEQIALMIDVLREECGDSFLQLFVDMCIFAINVDKGQMETNRNEGNREAAAARRSDMASICEKLSSLCYHISIKVARICALTAFALKPTEETVRNIAVFYGQGSDHSDKYLNGKNQGTGIVNPATLYEVERLLNMLRPGYLNPDQLYGNIQVLCRRYLQECLKKAEEFQKLQCSSQISSDRCSGTDAPIDSSEESAASTTSDMSTILAESLSFGDIQNIQQLLSRMRLLNIVHPSTSLRDAETSNPIIPSLQAPVCYDHTYQSNKTNPNILQMNKTPYMLGVKKVSIEQQQKHNLIKDGDRMQQKDIRAGEQLQSISMNQPPVSNLTHQHLQHTNQLDKIIQAALEQDSATLLKLAQASSPEILQTAISIIKRKLPPGSAQLEQSNHVQQKQHQLYSQLRQDQIREHSSQVQIPRPQLYNKPAVTSVSNNLSHFQVQAARAQVATNGSYVTPSSVAGMDSRKLATTSSLALHNINQGTPISSTTSGILSQDKLKAEGLMLARSCVGEIRHLLQSQLSGQQKQIREPQISGLAPLTSVSICSTSAGAQFSSSNKLQSVAELVKQTTVGKIQENFSQNLLNQIQQKISKQVQNDITVTSRPYTLLVVQPQHQQHRDVSQSNQRTISNLLVPSSVGLSEMNVGNGKSSIAPVPHAMLQSLKARVHSSIMPTVSNATLKPQSSSLLMVKPKIIRLSNLSHSHVHPSVIEVNKCPALYVTTCPVSCINTISQSSLNNHHTNPLAQHTFPRTNTVSQSTLNNKQPKPLYQNILPRMNAIAAPSLSNQQTNSLIEHNLLKMVSQPSLSNRQLKPSVQNTIPRLNKITVSSSNNPQTSPSVQHVFTRPNTIIVSSSNSQQTSPSVQHVFTRPNTIIVSSSNSQQTSPSVQHVFTRPNPITVPTLHNKEPKPLVQNISSRSSEEIPSGQQLEIILTNVASVGPKENITGLLQTDQTAKGHDTGDYPQEVAESKTVSDNNGTDVSNNALYRCILCSVAFKTLDDLRHHVKYVCKPEQQSSSVYNARFKLNRASATNAGVEATTVFQCLRCLELCISETGIKQHRLICKKVPQKSSQLNQDSTDNKEKETPVVTVCHSSSKIEENGNYTNRANQSEPEESAAKESVNNKTVDSCGGQSVSTESMNSSCQLTLNGQLEDDVEKQSVATVHENCDSESPRSHGSKVISSQQTVNDVEMGTLNSDSGNSLSKQIVVTSAVSQSENKQLGSSGPRNMSHIQAVNGVQIGSSFNAELTIIASQQTVSDVQTSSSLNADPRIILVNDAHTSSSLNTGSGIIASQQTMSDAQTSSSLNNQSGIIAGQQTVNDAQTSSSLNTDPRIIASQQTENNTQKSSSLNTESGIIVSQTVSDAQTSSSLNTDPRIISVNDVQTSSSLNTDPRIISVNDVQTSSSLNTDPRIISVNDVQTSSSLNTDPRIISVNDVQTSSSLNTDPRIISVNDVHASNTESNNSLHNIPELTSQSAVLNKSECIILPQLSVTSSSNKTLAARTPDFEIDKCNLVTFQPNLIQQLSTNNSENLPPLSVNFADYSHIPQISVAPVIMNTAYQMPLNTAFINSGNVFAKKNMLFPLSKLCVSIDDVIISKNILANDGLVDISPRKQVFKNSKDLPRTACAGLAGSCGSRFVICRACSRIVSSSSSFQVHLETCSMRNKTLLTTRALQEKVQNAKHLRDNVMNGFLRIVENVAGEGGDAPKVVHFDAAKSSVSAIIQACTDAVQRGSQENADPPVQFSVPQNNVGSDESSQEDIKEIDSGAGNIDTRDVLVLTNESCEIKEDVVNEWKDGDSVIKTLLKNTDAEDGLSQVKNEAHIFSTCVEEAVKSVKTKENIRYSKVEKTNTRTEVNLGKGSLFCKVCQVLYCSGRTMLQHFVVKHLKPYTVKTSSSSHMSYVCHFCQSTCPTFKQYTQHVLHHSVIVHKMIKSFQSAKLPQKSQRNTLQKKLTKKCNVSKNITITTKNRNIASKCPTSRLKRQHLAVKTRSVLDRWRRFKRLHHSSVPAGKNYNCNKFDNTVVEHNKSAAHTNCSSETICVIETNSANHGESCCQVDKNVLNSPKHVRDNCNQELLLADQIVNDSSSRDKNDSPVTRRRRKVVMRNHNWLDSKRRKMSNDTEISERGQEHSTLENRTPSGQSDCNTNQECSEDKNSKSLDRQFFQSESADLLAGYDKMNGTRNNSSESLNEDQRKCLQSNGAHPKSDETLLCSKDVEVTSSCNNDLTITADNLQLPVVKNANRHSISEFHVDVTVRQSSYTAPEAVQPSFLDSYLSYLSNYP